MQERDLSDVCKLAIQLGYQVTLTDVATRFKEIQSLDGYALFVAQVDTNKVIGYVQINYETKTLLAGSKADIAALVVDEGHRGQRVGSKLVAAAEEWAKQQNVEMIRVRSNVKRTDAHRFYLREGYELSKISNIFVKSVNLSITEEKIDMPTKKRAASIKTLERST